MPNKALVETKSLKLFLWSYRNRKAFNEMLVQEIHDELQVQLRPKYLFVQGRFHARGGIAVTASAGDIPVFKGE
jgi:7-cyano-7-deazaguanine reductase